MPSGLSARGAEPFEPPGPGRRCGRDASVSAIRRGDACRSRLLILGRRSTVFLHGCCWETSNRGPDKEVDHFPFKGSGSFFGLGCGSNLKKEGQNAGLGTHVSTYRSGNPFWNSGFLSHSHMWGLIKIPFAPPNDCRGNSFHLYRG